MAVLMPTKSENLDMVINEEPDDGVYVIKTLDVYETFHCLTRDSSWNRVPGHAHVQSAVHIVRVSMESMDCHGQWSTFDCSV